MEDTAKVSETKINEGKKETDNDSLKGSEENDADPFDDLEEAKLEQETIENQRTRYKELRSKVKSLATEVLLFKEKNDHTLNTENNVPSSNQKSKYNQALEELINTEIDYTHDLNLINEVQNHIAN